MAKYGQYGHFYQNMAILAIFDHKPYDQNYGHDGYPWKDNKKTNSPVKKLSDLDVWVKIYGQKMDFEFFKKNLDFFKNQKWPKNPLFTWKIKILRPLLFLQLLKLKK